MTQQTILHINSSGRLAESITREVSSRIVDILNSATPSHIIYRDLAEGLPFIDEQWINANFTDPSERTAVQNSKLQYSNDLVSELKRADTVVIGSPIYNFSIPAVLKAWIDLIARARETFRYTNDGPIGLLDGKRVIIVMAAGGVKIGSEVDFASRYLRQVMQFIGIKDITIVDAVNDELSQPKIEQIIHGSIQAEAIA